MDNHNVDVVSIGWESFAKAFELTWLEQKIKASHYKVLNLSSKTEYYQDKEGKTLRHYTSLVPEANGTPTLVLCCLDGKITKPLPFPLERTDAIAFCRSWLGTESIWGRAPDHDGDNKRGWRVFSGGITHTAGCGILVCVQPAWITYGK